MKKTKLIVLSLLSLVGTSLAVGGVVSGWAVTDNADAVTMRIGLSEGFTIKFMNYDGTSTYYSEEVIGGTKLATPPSDPTLEGYTFDGWTTNNTTYIKSSDDFSTKTFTSDVTYYPRFASYGYVKNSGSAAHLPNKWDINNNISFAQNDVINVGTYIYGKSSLENEAGSTATITNGGGYAVVCGENESSWNSSSAATFSNWHIEKYYTLDITNNWSSYSDRLFAHYYYDNVAEHKTTRKLYQVSGNTYYSYAPYNMTKVVYLALWENTSETSGPNSGWTNVKYKLPEITLSDTSSYEMIDRTFTMQNKDTGMGKAVFLVGNFHGNFEISTAYKLSWTSGNNWVGTFSFIKGTSASFKFVVGDEDTGGNASWENDPNRSETFNSTGSSTYTWK